MSIQITNQSLSKIEQFLKELGWNIRYEKGNFQSGSCLFKSQKTVVINKFIPLEQKISTLGKIILSLNSENSDFNLKQIDFVKEVINSKIIS